MNQSLVFCCNTTVTNNAAPSGPDGFVGPVSNVDLGCSTFTAGQFAGNPVTVNTNPDCPDLNASTAGTRAAGQVWVTNIPICTGDPLTHAFAPGGVVVDATVDVQMISCTGVAIAGVPADHMWLETTLGNLATCRDCCSTSDRVPIADAPTGPAGRTTFSNPVCAGGCTDAAGGEMTQVMTSWGPLGQPMDIQFHSPDMNGDGIMNLADIPLFAQAYFVAYTVCADFHFDGVLNLSDFAALALANGTACAGCP